MSLRLIPPIAVPFDAADLRSARRSTAEEHFGRRLGERFGYSQVEFHSSGRAALASLIQRWIEPQRSTIVVPAYTCWSVAASVVRAGARVRLVDVDPQTLDLIPQSLDQALQDDVALVIGAHLFSRTVDVDALCRQAHEQGVRVIDDAAQALPQNGSAADAVLLSFGRGKPIALGDGGALLHRETTTAAEPQQPHSAWGLEATLRLADPRWFRIPQSLPFLGIGKTVYDPNFTLDGAPDSWQRRLGERQWERLDQINQRRAALAHRFADLIKEPWLVPALASMKAGPLRLPLLAPDRERRDRFMQAMRRHGVAVSKMYPSTLAGIEELRLHLDGPFDCPGAESLADRLATVPTYPSMSEADADRIERALEACL